MTNCIVCGTQNITYKKDNDQDAVQFDCPRCGSFALTRTAEATLTSQLNKTPIRRSLMSHILRQMQIRNAHQLHVISSDELSSFWSADRLPTPQQQLNNIILWVGNEQKTTLDWVEARSNVIAAMIGLPISPGDDSQGWGWLHSQIAPMNLYRLTDRGAGKNGLQLTLAGWNRYEELKRSNINSRTAFMAMKFGDATLDKVVVDCFRPAVARAGFELRLLTDNQPAGLIDNQLRAAILSARFLIADLTHGSFGAYWEAGFADGLGLPVIYTCEASQWETSKTHFDTNHMMTIIWREAELEIAQNQLTATIRATLRSEAKQRDD